MANTNYTLRLFGYNFNDGMLVTFTNDKGPYKGACLHPATNPFQVTMKFLKCLISIIKYNKNVINILSLPENIV